MKRDYFSCASDHSSVAEAAEPGRANDHLAGAPAIDNGDLRQRVELFLAGSNIPALRQIRVVIEGDAVVMRGTVHTFYEKQMAIQFAQRVAGVIRTIDQIEVRSYVPNPLGGPRLARRSESTTAPSNN